MNSIEKLKLTQLRKLFIIYKSKPHAKLECFWSKGRSGFVFYKSEQV
jgi:hypothetical protein